MEKLRRSVGDNNESAPQALCTKKHVIIEPHNRTSQPWLICMVPKTYPPNYVYCPSCDSRLAPKLAPRHSLSPVQQFHRVIMTQKRLVRPVTRGSSPSVFRHGCLLIKNCRRGREEARCKTMCRETHQTGRAPTPAPFSLGPSPSFSGRPPWVRKHERPK